MKTLCKIILPLVLVWLSSCMEWDYGRDLEDFDIAGDGLFIFNEGNFQYSNASLSFYDPSADLVQNEVFFRANGFKLGDVANSMTMHGDLAWVAVNNSHILFAIDKNTFKEVGRIENFTSPRYIHFIDNTKAYVSQLWDNRIFIINPSNYSISGYITIDDMAPETASTEQMVQFGKYVYCNCWSYQNSILKIDTESDKVVDRMEIGVQPRNICLDRNGKLWVLTDGGYEGNPIGYEAPTLCRLDAATFSVERVFRFRKGDIVSDLQLNGAGDKLYWINNDLWSMDVTANRLPLRPLVKAGASGISNFYAITVNPVNSEIYIADALDYQQSGVIYRLTPEGDEICNFNVGVTPGGFCWK